MTGVVGILGGMGPRATVQFEQLLLDRLEGSDQELPVIVTINDGTIPDRSSFVTGVGRDPLPRMQRNLDRLEQLGAEIICIPCNTACTPQIFDRLHARQAKILNLPQEVGQVLVRHDARKVCILATAGTVASGVYQDVCGQAGVVAWVPPPHLQKLVDSCILLVKQNRLVEARQCASHVEAAIIAGDIDTVLLGCTELPLIKASLAPSRTQVVDTLEVLAMACSNMVKQGVYT